MIGDVGANGTPRDKAEGDFGELMIEMWGQSTQRTVDRTEDGEIRLTTCVASSSTVHRAGTALDLGWRRLMLLKGRKRDRSAAYPEK